MEKASAYHAAGIYGLLRTHEWLDAGEATQNIAIHSRTEIQGLDRLCEMLSESLIHGETVMDMKPETVKITSENEGE